MGKCGHYTRWREDFGCAQQLGLSVLRYGPPSARQLRFQFADLTFADLLPRDILPIVDLCHFGRSEAQRPRIRDGLKHLFKADVLAMQAALKSVRTPSSSRANRRPDSRSRYESFLGRHSNSKGRRS